MFSILTEISNKYLKFKESMGYELFAFLTMSLWLYGVGSSFFMGII